MNDSKESCVTYCSFKVKQRVVDRNMPNKWDYMTGKNKKQIRCSLT